jgi:hypothetical protein
MAEVPMGNIVQVEPPENPGLPGNRNVESLQKAFKNSPTIEGQPYAGKDDAVKTQFENLVLNGEVQNGFGLSSYNRDFINAPDVAAVEEDNDGNKIVSPYAPNVASPNEDGIQEDEVKPFKGAGGAFTGDQLANPSKTSGQISRLTLGSFGLGTSKPQGSE